MVWGELLAKIEDDGCMEGLQNFAELQDPISLALV